MNFIQTKPNLVKIFPPITFIFITLIFITSIFISFTPLISSSAHVHVHESHRSHSKERIEDGHVPRSRDHYNDDGHNNEFDHQAILGSKSKAKEFDQLSDEESKRRLKLLVTKGGMDADSDGYVDMIELINWILKSFQNLAEEDGIERFEEEDHNEDGFVTWSEHLKDNFDVESELDELVLDSVEDQILMKEDKHLWEVADKDGDGMLDRSEFPAFNSPEEYAHMKDVLYLLTLNRRDKNRDGLIHLKEYLLDDHGNIPDSSSEHYKVEKERFEQDYDSDKDGYLNRNEVMKWIIPDNQDMAEQEAEHLLITSDDNNDDKLSVDEILHHHDLFVGSEATDFGEKLKLFKDEL